MKNSLIIACLVVFCSLSGFCQTGKEKLDKARKQAQDERDRSFGGFKTDDDLKDERSGFPKKQKDSVASETRHSGQSNSASTSANKKTKQVIEPNQDQGTAQSGKGDSSMKASTPAVIQSTTSESGSPSVLSRDNRDGTNNIQRSKLNTAGAVVNGNWHLDRNIHTEKNANTGTPQAQREEGVAKADTTQIKSIQKQSNNSSTKKQIAGKQRAGQSTNAAAKSKRQKSG